MKIALYKSVEYGYESAKEAVLYEDDDSYIRTSEIVDIKFQRLPYGEAEKKEIAMIDKQINKVMAVSEAKINELKQKKADLLALTNQE